MLNKRKLLASVLTSAVTGAVMVAGSGVSQADEEYNFRLSQFSFWRAKVCVKTDVEEVCSGNWFKGKSEVFQVSARNPDTFSCRADIESGPDEQTGYFSRGDVKECALRGAPAANTYIDLIGP